MRAVAGPLFSFTSEQMCGNACLFNVLSCGIISLFADFFTDIRLHSGARSGSALDFQSQRRFICDPLLHSAASQRNNTRWVLLLYSFSSFIEYVISCLFAQIFWRKHNEAFSVQFARGFLLLTIIAKRQLLPLLPFLSLLPFKCVFHLYYF